MVVNGAGPEGVKECLETKTITIALNQKNS
jgi:hypothetical protein